MSRALTVNLEKLGDEPYLSILCYPRPNKEELNVRLGELQRLGINALEFIGEKKVFNMPILGKGYVGIVTIAHRDNERIALKIRRLDADRKMMQHEARMLEMANSVDVGPKILGVSRNFLLMQFIDGDLLPKWLEKPMEKARVEKVLREILEQCWRLDNAGLDHGELSYAPKHIIVNEEDKPFIIDFETASLNRKPSNVTAICQFLFIGSAVAKKVTERLGKGKDRKLIEALRSYKRARNREEFDRVLDTIGL